MKIGAVAVIFAIVAAGCTSKGADPAATLQTDAGTGVLEGVVVDAGIRPVMGANVTLGMNSTVATDEGGNFVFPPQAPGTYVMRVEHPNFAVAESPVSINAGQTTQAKVFLVPLRSPVPIHFTQDFKGRVEVGLGILNDVGNTVLDTLGQPNCQCQFDLPADIGLRSILLEAVWADSVAPPPGYGATIYTWNVNIGPSAVGGAGPSPIYRLLVPHDFTATGADGSSHPMDNFTGVSTLRITLYPDQTWPAIQQDYDLYVTLWYNGLPPEGWSFVGGSK